MPEYVRNWIFMILLYCLDILCLSLTNSVQDLRFQSIFNQNEAVPSGKSKEMQRYMNLSADPCQDFYEFACGNWNKYHELPKSAVSQKQQQRYIDERMPLKTLESKIDLDLQSILFEQNALTEDIAEHKVKDFYKSCLNAIVNGQDQQTFFSKFITAHDGCPAVPGSHWQDSMASRYDWQKVVIDLSRNYGMNILVGMDVDLNFLNPNESSIYFGEPSTLIPSELCSAEGTIIIGLEDQRYADIEQKVARDLKTWLTIDMDDAVRIAVDIVYFEYELCKGMKVNKTSNQNGVHHSGRIVPSTLYENYARRSLHDFTHRFNDTIDFQRFVLASYDIDHSSKPVSMRSEPYFRHLINTLQASNKSTIANYIIYRGLSSLTFPSGDRKSQRSQYCVQLAKRHFPKVLGYMYYRRYANVMAKNEIDGIFERIKDAFQTSLREYWLSDFASRLGLTKLSEIQLYLPKYDEKESLAALRIDRNKYWDNLSTVSAGIRKSQKQQLQRSADKAVNIHEVEAYEARALYRPQYNRIEFGWALMQQPLFHEFYPKAIWYATIGVQIAAALATAFDNFNWSTDLYGYPNWDYPTEREYLYRMECFRRQLSNYLYNEPTSYQNMTVLRDVIAKSAGINAAFDAYLLWLDYLNPTNDFEILRKETLPHLNLSNTQLFFVSFAQMHCHYENISRASYEVVRFSYLQGHTAKRWTVNGAVANSMEFARDFGCAQGLEMHPADKCIIY